MSKEETNDKILGLIKWIDSHESDLIRSYDVFSGWWNIIALLFGVLFFISELLNLITASMTERISIVLASLAVFFAVVSIILQTSEKNIVNQRFKRALTMREFDDSEKIFVKALIKIRSENDQFKLELVWKKDKEAKGDMFSEKRLLEKLYGF